MSSVAAKKRARQRFKKLRNQQKAEVWNKRFGAAKQRDGSVIFGRGTYTDSVPSRGYDDWLTRTASADYDTLPDRDALVGRARDLDRNNGYAKALRLTLVREVVGRGIRPRPARSARALGWKPKRVRSYARNVTAIWNKWIPKAYVRGGHFYQLQRMVEAALVRDGESFVHFVSKPSPQRPYDLAVDLIEAHRVSTPTDRRLVQRRGRRIRDGVEIDNQGEAVAIWVELENIEESAYFGERLQRPTRSRWRRIPMMDEASGLPNVVHVHDPDRPSTRSVPLTAGALDQIHVLGEFVEAELLAKKAEGCIAGAITSEAAESVSGDGEGPDASFDLEPGLMARLLPGESVSFLDPKRPGGSFGPFVEFMLRSIAFSAGIPYEVAYIAFAGMNYSNARTTLLHAHRYFEMRQDTLIEKLCRPAFCRLMWEAWVRDELKVARWPEMSDELCSLGFTGQGFRWVDPEKEAKADVLLLENGLTSKSRILARHGEEFEEVVGDLVYEREVEDDEGLEKKEPAPAAPPAPPVADPENEEADDE